MSGGLEKTRKVNKRGVGAFIWHLRVCSYRFRFFAFIQISFLFISYPLVAVMIFLVKVIISSEFRAVNRQSFHMLALSMYYLYYLFCCAEEHKLLPLPFSLWLS